MYIHTIKIYKWENHQITNKISKPLISLLESFVSPIPIGAKKFSAQKKS